ncbi:hypothetical protein [Pseudomonas sichuanensis]|uniref:Uncharacterized protein n=1 Tax=Pseudomonas sichuanensis TaxID=2213015 RepID=A0ABV0DFW3_9PSED
MAIGAALHGLVIEEKSRADAIAPKRYAVERRMMDEKFSNGY